MQSVLTNLLLLGICALGAAFQVKRMHPIAGSLALISPSVIFLVGIAGRYGLGGLIMALTPRRLVLEGELDQYIVSWRYNSETAGLWIAYIGCIVMLLWLLSRVVGLCKLEIQPKRNKKSVFGMWSAIKTGEKGSPRIFQALVLVIAGIFAIGSLMAAWTGSLDRGSLYNYWAAKQFRPESAFIAFSRIKQIAYFLIPASLVGAKKEIKSLVLILASIPLVAESLAGGRGSVLYPAVMLMLGWITIERSKKLVVMALTLSLMLGAISVPYIAAYRDSEAFQQTNHRDVIGRVTSIFSGVSNERLIYRFQALGREMYACSDSFLFVPSNAKHLGAGFKDINIGFAKELLLPRWLSDNKSLEKFDGSGIAQKLIGTKRSTWFPCISTSGDLWRRGAYISLIAGGCFMGCVLFGLDYGWAQIGSRYGGTGGVLITLLPVSYIQSGLFGTIREMFWQLSWDLPKYLVLCILLSLTVQGIRWRRQNG